MSDKSNVVVALQWITIAKIGGEAGNQTLARFGEWATARVSRVDEPGSVDPSQWPAEYRNDADDFVRQLARRASNPPVLFYCRYIDSWSMGDAFESFVGVAPLAIHTAQHSLYCRDLANCELLLDHLKRTVCRRGLHQEQRWHALLSREAINAWKQLSTTGALIVIREPLGGLVEDREVEDSLETQVDWL